LTQVLINLLQNSLDAISEKHFEEEKPAIIITGRSERDLTILTVRDNGQGIESEVIGKVFDPFFTTKDVGQGMGLGLSICYRIVQEFEGRISVKSERGKFCEFTLEFPVRQAHPVLQA
jgi:C4-dicarboxylate-specific signal transduction histidine kinase